MHARVVSNQIRPGKMDERFAVVLAGPPVREVCQVTVVAWQ